MKEEKKEKTIAELDKVFGQLVKDHNTVAPGSATTGDKMFAETKVWIPTGSSILDIVISNSEKHGGWPAGRTVELYGEEAIGKSTLTFTGLAKTQKAGGVAIYYDVEQAGARNMMEACGIDMKRLIYSNNSSLEEIFETLEKNLKTIVDSGIFKGKPVLAVLDSLAQMMSDAEIEGSYDHNMNIALKKAMQLGKAIRKITPLLNKANACLIIINQLRDAPGVTYGPSETTPGGKALKFAATVRIKLLGKTPVKIMDPNAERVYKGLISEWEVACKQWKSTGGSKVNGPKPKKPPKPKGDEIIVGYDVIARTDKNKVGPPKREAEFRIVFGKGIIQEYAWFDYAFKFGLIEDAGDFCFKIPTFPEIQPFRRVSWINILNSNPKFYKFIDETVKLKMVRSIDEYQDVEEDTIEEDVEGLNEEELVDTSTGEIKILVNENVEENK